MGKIKVLYIIETWGPGGAEKIVLDLAKNINRDKFHPIVGLLNTGWLYQELMDNGIETVLIRNKHSLDPKMLWELIKLINQREIKIIHAHEFTMNVYAAMAGALTGKPSLLTVHGTGYYTDKLQRWLFYKLISYLPKVRIIAVSNFLKNFFCKATRVNRDKVFIVHNGVALSRFTQKKKPFDSNNSDPFIGTVGNIYPIKGHECLISAAQIVKLIYPKVCFLVAGKNTEYRSDLERLAEERGIAENIKFIGFCEDIPAYLGRLDIFVLTSIRETFSIALAEAMATGLPVVSTRCGGPQELVTDGENGFLVPVNDYALLAEKIILLLRNSKQAQTFGQRGQQLVAENFSLEKMISKYEHIYDTLLRNS